MSRCVEVAGISERTVQRWRHEDDGGEDRRRGPNTVPGNKLSEHEERRLLNVLTSPEYRDLSPRQVIPALAEKGQGAGGESSNIPASGAQIPAPIRGADLQTFGERSGFRPLDKARLAPSGTCPVRAGCATGSVLLLSH